jgi:hypothetical protein
VQVNQEIRNPPVSQDLNTTQAWVIPAVLNPTSAAAKALVPHGNVSGYESPDSYLDRFDNWVFTHGGATVGVTYLRVTLTAGQRPVLVQSICAHIVSRTKTLSGTLFFKPPQGQPIIETTLDLDDPQPCANYFETHYILLSPRRPRVLSIAVVAHADTVVWNLFLDAIVNGKQEYIPVGGHEVLRTTGLLSRLTEYHMYYEYSTGAGYSQLFRPTILGPGDQVSIESALGSS